MEQGNISYYYIEIFFISKINASYIFLCSTIYPFIKSILKFSVYIFFLKLIGNHDFLFISILKSFIILVVMIIPFIALSFVALSFVLYFKQANPINSFINLLITIFSGILYPVSVLPTFMQDVSHLIPLTSQLNSVRHVLINNAFDEYIFSSLFYMHSLFSMLFLVICIKFFTITINLVKRKGTISSY